MWSCNLRMTWTFCFHRKRDYVRFLNYFLDFRKQRGQQSIHLKSKGYKWEYQNPMRETDFDNAPLDRLHWVSNWEPSRFCRRGQLRVTSAIYVAKPLGEPICTLSLSQRIRRWRTGLEIKNFGSSTNTRDGEEIFYNHR